VTPAPLRPASTQEPRRERVDARDGHPWSVGAFFFVARVFAADSAVSVGKDDMEGTSAVADTSSAAPSGGNTPDARPTFEQAFAADASPASDTPASATASPEGPAANTGSDAPADDRSPFIPRSRFDSVNTERNELRSKMEALKWAEQVNPDAFQQVHGWYEKAKADPKGFVISEVLSQPNAIEILNDIAERLQNDPARNAELRSFIGKKLAQQRQSQPEAAPQFLIPQPDGSVAVDMAQFPKWQEWNERQVLQKLTGEIQPIKERLAAEDKRIEAVKQAQAVDEFADHHAADARTWPGMDNDTIRTEVAQEYWRRVEHKTLSNEQLLVELNAAWRTVAVPKLNARSESKLLDSLQQKAHASTGVAPGSAASAATGRPKSFDDPSLKW
jgi:hypothetical protein